MPTRTIDNWIFIAFSAGPPRPRRTFPAAPSVRRGRRPGASRATVPGVCVPGTRPAVGQRQGRLIWVEDDGGSSPSSWTRRPQDALLPAERAPRTCPVTEIRTTSGAGHSTPVAQLERAPVYEAGECRFESCRACCVRSRSGRCAGTWTRRKRVRAPPDTPVRRASPRTTTAPHHITSYGARRTSTTCATGRRTRKQGPAALAQLVEAAGLGPEGSGFESPGPHHTTDTEITDLAARCRAHWRGGGTT
jgi:hypothetical protein